MIRLMQQQQDIAMIGRRGLLVGGASLALTACAGSTAVQTRAPDYVGHSVRTVAMAPPDELFDTDTVKLTAGIGANLSKLGYTVIDSHATATLLAKNNVEPVNLLKPPGLTACKAAGIDAILTVNSAPADIGGPAMRYVNVTVTSTQTQQQIGEIRWRNAWAGMPGSPADYTVRKGADTAAQEIAENLAKLLG